MIEIKIDEDACVGCTLCVEECPTDVFEFNEEKNIPDVVKQQECFGCLSCSEICPATAITHSDVIHSADYYHDPYTLDLAAKLAPDVPLLHAASNDTEKKQALADLGVRLFSIAEIFRQTLGDSLPAIGTMAGRTLATQLPRFEVPESFEEALDLSVKQFSPAWELKPDYDGGEKLNITIGNCFVRELCRHKGTELGGDLCVLFYNYFAGYLGRMSGSRLKLLETVTGDSCKYCVQVFAKR